MTTNLARRAPNLPFGLFSIPLGLAGLGMVMLRCAVWWGPAGTLGHALLAAGALAFLAVATAMLAQPQGIARRWADPVQRPFAGTATMALMALGAWLAGFLGPAGQVLWAIGAAGQLALSVAFLIGLTRTSARPRPVPSWLIILVGGILAPQGALAFGWPLAGWFFFYFAVALWLVLVPVLIVGLARTGPLPPPMAPTLTILIAPPGLAATAHAGLAGGLDAVGDALFIAAVVMALFVASRSGQFLRAPFGPPWWATTFPTSALAGAAVLRAQLAPGWLTGSLAAIALAIALATVALCASLTVQRLHAGRFLPPPQ